MLMLLLIELEWAKYFSEKMSGHLDPDQSAKIQNVVSYAFDNLNVNMGEEFLTFMDHLVARLKEVNCDMYEKEFESHEEFDICMNNIKIFGEELIDHLF